MPRTEYPRPWLGGRWTLRDIVDYELIATMATLEFAADQRETLLRQIYEVNRATIEDGQEGRSVGHPDHARTRSPTRWRPTASSDRLQMGGVKVYRADAAFKADDKHYPAGTFVVPMTQVFARYAKDLLEKQTYPEVRRVADRAARAAVRRHRLVAGHAARRRRHVREEAAARGHGPVAGSPRRPGAAGTVTGAGAVFAFDYTGPDAAIAINRLLQGRRQVACPDAGGGGRRRARPSRCPACRAKTVQDVAAALGLQARAPAKRRPAGAGARQGPARRALPALDRQHGRGLDALGDRAARVSRTRRCTTPTSRPGRLARAVRRHRLRRPAARQHRHGQRGARHAARSTGAALARTASRR